MMAEISNSIGRDNYGDVVQAGRDANVNKVTGTGDPLDALIALRRLRSALDGVQLEPDARTAAARAIEDVDAQLRGPAPDRTRVAGALERLTTILQASGALLTAGVALADPIAAIAQWLGPLGAAVLGSIR